MNSSMLDLNIISFYFKYSLSSSKGFGAHKSLKYVAWLIINFCWLNIFKFNSSDFETS